MSLRSAQLGVAASSGPERLLPLVTESGWIALMGSPRIASAQAGVLHLELVYRAVCSALEVVCGCRAREGM